jgi:hypothetical protein
MDVRTPRTAELFILVHDLSAAAAAADTSESESESVYVFISISIPFYVLSIAVWKMKGGQHNFIL